MNDPTILVLSSLAEGPRHGYAIMQDVTAFAGVTLGPGTLYGAIARLEQRGWIHPVGPATRRQAYAISAQGIQHLKERLAAMQRVAKTAQARLHNA